MTGAGIVAGLIYWMIAGRNAGAWRERPPRSVSRLRRCRQTCGRRHCEISLSVIPGRLEEPNPESRDSPGRKCAPEVWSFGPSRNDGISRMDVRATLRTDDGVLIHYDSQGVLRFPPDGRQRLAAGERLPFDEHYIHRRPGSRPPTSATRG